MSLLIVFPLSHDLSLQSQLHLQAIIESFKCSLSTVFHNHVYYNTATDIPVYWSKLGRFKITFVAMLTGFHSKNVISVACWLVKKKDPLIIHRKPLKHDREVFCRQDFAREGTGSCSAHSAYTGVIQTLRIGHDLFSLMWWCIQRPSKTEQCFDNVCNHRGVCIRCVHRQIYYHSSRFVAKLNFT